MEKIPVNIISGFLGAGKTTAILKLLSQKANDELWAVVINEFGKISIDTKTLQSASDSEDVYEIAKSNLSTTSVFGITSSQFLIDARPTTQFDGSLTTIAGPTANTYYITTSWGFSGAPSTSASPAQKFVAFEGGIKGAVTFPWADLLTESSTGFQYKTVAELEQIFTSKGFKKGQTVISQCRTNFEAQVNGFAALNILGYPTAYYDGSLVEWTSLLSSHPGSVNTVSSTFKWRTDTDSVSRILWYNGSSSDVSRVQTSTVDTTATTTKAFITEDKAYKN